MPQTSGTCSEHLFMRLMNRAQFSRHSRPRESLMQSKLARESRVLVDDLSVILSMDIYLYRDRYRGDFYSVIDGRAVRKLKRLEIITVLKHS